MNTANLDLLIIGGGVAGLSAAWYAQAAGLRYAVLEAGTRWGGKVYTHTLPSGQAESLRIEYAPDGFITRKPYLLDFVRALNAEDLLIPVNDTPERIYVLTGGRLHALPDGLHLLAPTKILPFLRSGLFSWDGKLRMLQEVFIPPRQENGDESLAAFVVRRFGQEALDKLGEPLLAGVYNADPHEQSILATFGNFRALEAQYGSVIRGMRARATQTNANVAPALMSFAGGMGALVDVLVAKLDGTLQLNAAATEVFSTPTGYSVRTVNGDTWHAARLLIATPPKHAAQLLSEVAPHAASMLASLRSSSVGSMSLAYRREDVPHPLDAYGVVIPSTERQPIDGITWTSAKWQQRAPQDVALLRVFFGGTATTDMLTLSDEARLLHIRAALKSILNITAAPLATHSAVWLDGYPQYDVHHAERVAQIMAALPVGVRLSGNAYYGVGLPDTVRTSQQAIQQILEAVPYADNAI